jgi:hypothetical protein
LRPDDARADGEALVDRDFVLALLEYRRVVVDVEDVDADVEEALLEMIL